ncbi:MAG: gamma-glutamyl-gamma-aminobutyrate hydrolase family protein [Actinomycetes bacterium]
MINPGERPLIGICASRETASWTVWQRQPAILVGSAYVDRVQEAGGSPVIVAPSEPADLRVLDWLHGLLLPGGLDLSPSGYGEPVSPECEDFDPARDEFELALAKAALERDMPVLGICRGLQVMNVALGGTLLQDLKSALGTDTHRVTVGSLDEGNAHTVELAPDSLASKIAGRSTIAGRSHHHQAVDRPGTGVVISGVSGPDGVPEAIEIEDRAFAVGVQWHAEATPDDSFIPAFVKAATTQRSSRA